MEERAPGLTVGTPGDYLQGSQFSREVEARLSGLRHMQQVGEWRGRPSNKLLVSLPDTVDTPDTYLLNGHPNFLPSLLPYSMVLGLTFSLETLR